MRGGLKMKLEARFETIGGRERPILFFCDEVNRDKTIEAFSEAEGHVSSSRGYLRQCRKPTEGDDFVVLFGFLARYFRDAERLSKI